MHSNLEINAKHCSLYCLAPSPTSHSTTRASFVDFHKHMFGYQILNTLNKVSLSYKTWPRNNNNCFVPEITKKPLVKSFLVRQTCSELSYPKFISKHAFPYQNVKYIFNFVFFKLSLLDYDISCHFNLKNPLH